MAEKKEAAATKKRAPATKKAAKGDAYSCEVCGLVVSVDEDCGCVEACDIICCGEPMKEGKAKARTTKSKA